MNGGVLVTIVCLCMLIDSSLSEIRDFSCDTDDDTKVFFNKNDLQCPDGLICNSKYKFIMDETKLRPCVAPSELCEYTCDTTNASLVFINSVQFVCPDNKECNTKKTSCDICVLKLCPIQSYSCRDGNTVLLPGGYLMACKEDEICNEKNEQPCLPCITNPAAIATTKTTTTYKAKSSSTVDASVYVNGKQYDSPLQNNT